MLNFITVLLIVGKNLYQNFKKIERGGEPLSIHWYSYGVTFLKKLWSLYTKMPFIVIWCLVKFPKMLRMT